MVGFGTSILRQSINSKQKDFESENTGMLHALPWCLVLGISVVVRLGPTLSFHVGFSECFSRCSSNSKHNGSIKEFGMGMRTFPISQDSYLHHKLNFSLPVNLSRYAAWFWTCCNPIFRLTRIPAQSIRIKSSSLHHGTFLA